VLKPATPIPPVPIAIPTADATHTVLAVVNPWTRSWPSSPSLRIASWAHKRRYRSHALDHAGESAGPGARLHGAQREERGMKTGMGVRSPIPCSMP
jgi:hypothetical protein